MNQPSGAQFFSSKIINWRIKRLQLLPYFYFPSEIWANSSGTNFLGFFCNLTMAGNMEQKLLLSHVASTQSGVQCPQPCPQQHHGPNLQSCKPVSSSLLECPCCEAAPVLWLPSVVGAAWVLY